jgi:hypothetical protein
MILWCHQSGIGVENNLAKFGYIIDMKIVKKNRILLYSWLPIGTYHKNLVIWDFFFLQNLVNLGLFFFPCKTLCIAQNLGKICLEKKHWFCVGAPRHRRVRTQDECGFHVNGFALEPLLWHKFNFELRTCNNLNWKFSIKFPGNELACSQNPKPMNSHLIKNVTPNESYIVS